MKQFDELLKLFRGSRTDVIGVDHGASGIKVVRLKQTDAQITLVAAEILPRTASITPSEAAPQALTLPRQLQSRYVAIATSAPGAIVKLLTLPLHSDKSTDLLVNELMGIGDSADYRVGYEFVAESRSERKILAAAIPDVAARNLCHLFPSGIPAPCSIEISGLASMTAFLQGPGAQHKNDTIAVIDFGATTSYVAFYNKGIMSLIRKFDFGSAPILRKLQESLGVDAEVALGILNDQSFDISSILRQTMEPFLQQMTISWDFVERRENSPIAHLYACGGLTSLPGWVHAVHEVTGQEPKAWNPFDIVTSEDAVTQPLKGQTSRFAAAMGAALAALRNR